MTPDINKILSKENTFTGFYNAENEWVCTGSTMGQMDRADDLSEPLYLQKIRLVDGAYGVDGTYWGGPDTMWCAFNPQTAVRIYQRAANRMLAIMDIESRHPTVKFKNNTLRVTGRYKG